MLYYSAFMTKRDKEIKNIQQSLILEQGKLNRSLENMGDRISRAIDNGATKDYIAKLYEMEQALKDALEEQNELIARSQELTENQNILQKQGQDILQGVAGSRTLSVEETTIINNLTSTLQELSKQEAELLEEKERLVSSGAGTPEGIATIENYIQATKDKISEVVGEAYDAAKNATGLDVSDLSKAIDELNDLYDTEDKRRVVGDEVLDIERESKKLNKEIADLQKKSVVNAKDLKKAEEENNEILAKRKERYAQIAQIASVIWDEMKKGASMWMKYNHQAMSDAKMLGITSKESARAYTVTMMENSNQLMRAFGMNQEQVAKMQETYSKVTGRATLLTQEQMKDIAASSQLMGEETVSSAIQMMNEMGTTSETATELLDKNFARAANTGLNTVKASEEFVKNMSLANKLSFKNGVDGISKMTNLSQRIKLNLQEVANVADKFSTIEGAIQSSAQLQMLGGAGAMFGGNPMQMMYEALADPEALFERMAEMAGQQARFDRKTGESRIDPVQMQIIREQEKALGMSPGSLIQSAKQQASLKDIRHYNQSLYGKIDNSFDRQEAEDLKATIENKATFNKEKQQWEIAFTDKDGMMGKPKALSELSLEDLKDIQKDRLDPVEDIKGNVRKIASELVSLKDRRQSLIDQKETNKALLGNGIMESLDDMATYVNNNWMGNKWVTTIGSMIFGLTSSIAVPWAFRKVGTKIANWTTKGGSAAAKGNSAAAKYIATGARAASEAEGATASASKASSFGARASRAANRAARGLGSIGARGASRVGTRAMLKLGGRSAARIGSKFLGPAAVLADVGFAAYDYYQAGETRKAEEEYINYQAQQQNAITGRSRYTQHEIDEKRKIANNKESEAKGEAIGAGTGALAGAAAGAAIGSVVAPVIGTGIGAAIGGLIGGIAGAFGGKHLAKKEETDTISKHLEEINDSDEEENLRRIVLPIESIDYNVALIANQLGILSAMPSRNNVYLDAEAAGEIKVESAPLQAGHVNPVDSYAYSQPQQTYTSGTVNLNISGTIDLNMNGQNGGKMTAQDIRNLIDNNPELQRRIADIITRRQNLNGNAGRNNYENSDNRRSTTNGTATGGL